MHDTYNLGGQNIAQLFGKRILVTARVQTKLVILITWEG